MHRLGRLRLSAPVAVRMVLTGFGTFAVFGGFSLDRLGLSLMGSDRETADRSVLSLGVLEVAVLAIAASIGAVILLATGSGVTGSTLWPWARGVPGGVALALRLARRIARGGPASRQCVRRSASLAHRLCLRLITTRRTLPFGGAAVVELLLTFSLSWVGVPLAGAFAGVVGYRGVDLILIAGLAMAARHRPPARAQLDAADDRKPSSGRPHSAL